MQSARFGYQPSKSWANTLCHILSSLEAQSARADSLHPTSFIANSVATVGLKMIENGAHPKWEPLGLLNMYTLINQPVKYTSCLFSLLVAVQQRSLHLLAIQTEDANILPPRSRSEQLQNLCEKCASPRLRPAHGADVLTANFFPLCLAAI